MFREPNPSSCSLSRPLERGCKPDEQREPEVCPGFLAACSGTSSPPRAVCAKAEINPKTARRSPSGSLCRGSNPQVSMAHCLSAEAQHKLPYGVRLAHLDGIELAPFGEPELRSIIFDDFFLRLDHLLADRRISDH